jgi:hypothetical protein
VVARRKWRCYICGDEVVEGQRFTVTSKGFVHLECLYEKIAEKGLSRDVIAYMDALEVLNYAITRLKEAEVLSSTPEARAALEATRRSLEAEAARLTKKLVEASGVEG